MSVEKQGPQKPTEGDLKSMNTAERLRLQNTELGNTTT